MPRLDARLKTVARQIRGACHVDVGSDHGHLLKAVIKAGRVEWGIAIENKRQPFLNSQATLAGLAAEVRFGDGLEPLAAGEADSLSICGMGGESIAKILSAFPRRVPDAVVLQPNKRPECVREWGLYSGFHLLDEPRTAGRRAFQILVFRRSASSPDPAYHDVDREAALLFGPHNLRRRDPQFMRALREERRYLEQLDRLDSRAADRLAAIYRVLVDAIEADTAP
ncbi:tRNA (adenine(22)-N(1))-methyltransferase [Roseimaritima ulvae]|uniref:tRNA (Adenine(22)-N(1))-methyltransferase n=1 Tax=Roseimaritima ulvae TaxID=980254 RepID=A0A5B9QYT5_9BACT|nr:class I SAM-dependent methyltransferase [Roseimaritima ulvae]QEG39161.1 tRNA (adenine(22)-N(1))-methyltransferase [Roseimaritima ulvae]